MILTISDLARARNIPENYLRQQAIGLRQYNAKVLIPYRRIDGKKGRTRIRMNLKGEYRWQRGDAPIIPYGEWLLPKMAENTSSLWIVEGESDCWALWYNKIASLGIPGIGMVRVLQKMHIEKFSKLLIWQEPDLGGIKFTKRLGRRLWQLGYDGEVSVIKAPHVAADDPSALYCRDPENFVANLQKAANGGKPLELISNSDFPTEVLPDAAARFVEEQAKALDVDESMLGPCVLGAMATAIGASKEVEAKFGYRQSTNLFLLLLAGSGTGKSPALKSAMNPLTDYQISNEEAILLVTNTTTEALSQELERNPRGIGLTFDEAVAWVRSMNQYKPARGSDREFYLKCWDRSMIEGLRKTTSAASVGQPHLSVLGCMPPAMIEDFTDQFKREDGFIPRILLVYLPQASLTRLTADELSKKVAADYKEFILELLALGENDADDFEPDVFTLTDDASSMALDWYNQKLDKLENGEIWTALKSPLGKIKSYLYRVALILHVGKLVAKESNSQKIDAESIRDAIAICEFFLAHIEMVYRSILRKEEDEEPLIDYVKDKILELVREQGGKKVLRQRKLVRAVQSKKGLTTEKLKKILKELEKKSFIERKKKKSEETERERRVIILNSDE